MIGWKCFGILFMMVSLLSAQQVVEDPVLKIQAERASRGEGDLPPVPRGILTPPVLPAPETHVKDTRGWRASRTARKSRRKSVKVTKRPPVTSRSKTLTKKKP
jgi:hypothetical protein